MTISGILTEGKKLLAAPCPEASIDTPSLDAALLLAEVLRTNREALIVRGNESINESDREKFLKLLERRRSGECAAYILGRKEFRGLSFTVSRNVLVPRPDTETLAEIALEYIDSMAGQRTSPGNISLLDLCTGSGALAVSLKNERPFLNVSASDISEEALEIAEENAARLVGTAPLQGNTKHSGSPIKFIHSDLFENIRGKFSIIVSNPPYIPSGELASLTPEVKAEPAIALDGGGDGLDLIRKIIGRATEYLQPAEKFPGREFPGGVLLLEAAPEQMRAIAVLLEKRGFGNIKIHRDLAGKDRVISAISRPGDLNSASD